MRFLIKKEDQSPDALADKCVICNKETGYFFSTPIDQRRFFVAGVGQLCRECYDTVYLCKVPEESGNELK